MKIAVVIPIYKPSLLPSELTSLRQCLEVLKRYQIIFVTHENLDCAIYKNICTEYDVKALYYYFDKQYFQNTAGYSSLMLSEQFYAKFIDYQYMLLYQLDAYVFFDQLDWWCKTDYDYIGGPWLEEQDAGCDPKFGVTRWGGLDIVGNGGLSLRKIKTFISNCSRQTRYLSRIFFLRSIILSNRKSNPNKISGKIYREFLSCRIKNLKFFHSKIIGGVEHEDITWSRIIRQKGKLPEYAIAMQFAFDFFPNYLYNLNNKKLPFGCHAWNLYSNYLFWKDHIKIRLN